MQQVFNRSLVDGVSSSDIMDACMEMVRKRLRNGRFDIVICLMPIELLGFLSYGEFALSLYSLSRQKTMIAWEQHLFLSTNFCQIVKPIFIGNYVFFFSCSFSRTFLLYHSTRTYTISHSHLFHPITATLAVPRFILVLMGVFFLFSFLFPDPFLGRKLELSI